MNFKPGQINLGYVLINTMDKASRFVMNQSFQTDMNNAIKNSEGFGENNSDHSIFIHPILVVDDSDNLDSHRTWNETQD